MMSSEHQLMPARSRAWRGVPSRTGQCWPAGLRGPQEGAGEDPRSPGTCGGPPVVCRSGRPPVPCLMASQGVSPHRPRWGGWRGRKWHLQASCNRPPGRDKGQPPLGPQCRCPRRTWGPQLLSWRGPRVVIGVLGALRLGTWPAVPWERLGLSEVSGPGRVAVWASAWRPCCSCLCAGAGTRGHLAVSGPSACPHWTGLERVPPGPRGELRAGAPHSTPAGFKAEVTFQKSL